MDDCVKMILAVGMLDIDMMTKKDLIEKSIYKSEVTIKYSEGAKIWYHYIPAKIRKAVPGLPARINATSEEALIEKLLDILKNGTKTKITLAEVYEEWMAERREDEEIAGHTYRDNERQWNKYMAPYDIIHLSIADITGSILYDHFKTITKKRAMKKKAFLNLKGICHQIWDYAILHDYVLTNVAKSVPIAKLKFDPSRCKDFDIYLPEERESLCNYLEQSDDPHDLIIVLAFCLVVRISELRGLHWSDCDFTRKTIYIHQMYVDSEKKDKDDDLEENGLKPHTKNGKDEGNRFFPMTDRAIRVLSKIPRPDEDEDDYVFKSNGNPVKTQTVNSHIESACNLLGIRYLSSHKIRATGATAAADAGADKYTIKRLGGWASDEAAEGYIRMARLNRELSDKYHQIFN